MFLMAKAGVTLAKEAAQGVAAQVCDATRDE